MSQADATQGLSVQLCYRELPGYALFITVLARRIEHCFQVPVGLVAVDAGDIGLKVNGRFAYIHPPGADLRRFETSAFTELCRYTPKVRETPEEADRPDAQNDPDHQAWMRSVCSGE